MLFVRLFFSWLFFVGFDIIIRVVGIRLRRVVRRCIRSVVCVVIRLADFRVVLRVFITI